MKHWDRINKTIYDEPEFDHHKQLIDIAFKQFISGRMFNDVLDVGVGTGYAFNKFKELGMQVKGTTMSSNEVPFDESGAIFKLDMADMPFDDSSFDLVWCRHALEHSVMPYIALLEFERVARKGGFVYIEVPADNMLHIENENHYSLFSDQAWQALFRKAGLHLVHRGQFLVNVEGCYDIYWQYWMEKC